MLREGANINKSLLALSNVIHQLSQSQRKFINFRDSKLTRILQPSLGGNSKTLIVCTVSQIRENYQETMNTLLFGVKAKKIKNVIKVNEGVIDEASKLSLALKEIERLKAELKLLASSSQTPDESCGLLKDELKEKTEEIITLKELIRSSSRSYNNLALGIENLKSMEINHIAIVNDEDPNKYNEALTEFIKEKERKTMIEIELEKLSEDKENYNINNGNEFKSVWIEDANKKEELEKIIEGQNLQIKNLMNQISILKQRETNENMMLENSEDINEDEMKENNELLSNVDALNTELEKNKKTINHLKKINEKYAISLKSETNKKQVFEKELKKLSVHSNYTSIKLYEKIQKVKVLEKEKESLNSDIASYKSDLIKLKREEDKIFASNKLIKKLRNDVDEILKENDSIGGEINMAKKRKYAKFECDSELKRRKIDKY